MGYIWNSLPYDYHREFPQVTDDADLNLVTKASRNNPLLLTGLKSVDLKIIQMYHFGGKMLKIYGMHKLVGLQLFGNGTPTFCQIGVLNSRFQNPSESSDI